MTSSSRRALIAAALLAVLGAGGAAAQPGAEAIDALLQANTSGDTAALEAALPAVTDPARAALARLKIAAGRLDAAEARRAADAYAASGDRDQNRQAAAWSTEARVAFAAGDYLEAARAADNWLKVLPIPGHVGETQDAYDLRGVAAVLATAPRQAVAASTPHRIATVRDAAGLARAPVLLDGTAADAVLDTGANLSTISASMAARLRLRILHGAASVGSSTREAVRTRVGVADRLDIAGVTLRDVAFLVVDDDQLKLPIAGYRVDMIVGFPVFRALGRVTFGADDSFTPQPPAPAGSEPPPNLHFSGSSLFVFATLNGTPANLQLDTGADGSSLTSRFAQRHPEVLKGLERRTVRRAGAGGATEGQAAIWKDVRVAIGGGQTLAPSIAIDAQPAQGRDISSDGVIGQDILKPFAAYTIDFTARRFDVSPAAGPPSG
jgi:predicted aspartyl protease